MKTTVYSILMLVCFTMSSILTAQHTDSANVKKKRWSYGFVPAIAYEDDIGFKYGAVFNLFNYGDWKIYPEYYHSFFLEWSQTTKGSGIMEFSYDSKHLIPNIRTSTEISYLTERALDFYGFNGAKSLYDYNYINYKEATTDYKSWVFYKQERQLLRIRGDVQGRFFNDKIHWMAGVEMMKIKIDSVNLKKLNKGISESDTLKYLRPKNENLYEIYLKNGIIKPGEANGGNHTHLKLGLVYDTRDNEPKPTKGMWTEAIFILSPSFLSNTNNTYAKLVLTHRQYFNLVKNRLDFAYRVSYQDKLWGDMPYYMLPFAFNGGKAKTRDALGGAKTLRGIRRNRIVGDDILYGNFELRWVFLRKVIMGRNIYFALNTFTDLGMVTSEYQFDKSGIATEYNYLFPDESNRIHQSAGMGLHFALNENFVVACNYGFALNQNDGENGLYIGLNWLY
ncbi:MAG: BamA/TamA family outer membrane protein [Bacteroidales bacterium]|nr:BamA/TamA family outer membrane protein [Bacteroidales bacterium]